MPGRVPTHPPPPSPDPGAICAAFALGLPHGVPVFAARGELGRVWRMETSRGTWAIKELFGAATEEDAAADVAFQSAAIEAGVPMPRPIPGVGGRVLASIPADGRTALIRVYSWIDLADPARRVTAPDAAAILGRLHAMAYPDDGAPGTWFTEPVEHARWEAILAAADAGRTPSAATLASLIPALVAGDGIIRAGRHVPTIRCHLDFNRDNVLVDAAGHAVVVDWENSGPAAAEQELASALAEFDPGGGVADFLRAYAEAGGPATLRDHTSFAMTLAVQQNLVAWHAERAVYPGSSAEDRARSEHWIGEIATDAFTLERIDRLIVAARSGRTTAT